MAKSRHYLRFCTRDAKWPVFKKKIYHDIINKDKQLLTKQTWELLRAKNSNIGITMEDLDLHGMVLPSLPSLPSSLLRMPPQSRFNPKAKSGMTLLTSSKKMLLVSSTTLVTGSLPTSLNSGRRTSWISGLKM